MAPRVPTLRSNARTDPLPGVRERSVDTSAEDFGRLGESLGQVSEVVQNAQLRADSIAFDEFQVGAGNDWNEVAYDPEKGAFNTQGKNAANVTTTALEEMDKRIGERIASLGNERQKERARQWWDQKRVNDQRQLEIHTAREIDRYDDEVHASKMAQLGDEARSNPYDPIAVLGSISAQKQAVAEYHARKGVDNVITQRAQEEVGSANWGNVIMARLKAGDDLNAEDLYQARKDEIIPEHREKLEEVLGVGGRLGQAQRIADRIIDSGVDMKEAREQWREIDDPELRDLVQGRVEREFSLRARIEQERKEGIFQSAHDLLSSTGGRVEFLPHWMTDLDSTQTEALQRHQANLLNPGPKVNDNQVWTRLATLDRQQWAGMSEQQLLTFEPYLDQSHYDRALTMWREARDPVSGTPTLTFKDRVDTALRGMPFFDFDEKPSDWNKEQSEFYAIFETATAREVAEFEERTGRKASPEELQSVIDGMVRAALRVPRASTGPIVWNHHADIELQRAALNAAGLDPLGPTLDQIPPATREGIANRIRGNGGSVTPDRIERFYAAMLQGDEAAGQRILEER